MRKELTVGELAKLFQITTHTIRYYEKQELLKPTRTLKNNYRLYDFESALYLSVILALRKNNVSIKEIKKLKNNFSKTQYLQALEISRQKIDDQIKELERIKLEIENITSISEIFNTYFITTELERTFYILKENNCEFNYSIKELYDTYHKHNIDTSTIYKDNIFFSINKNNINHLISKKIAYLKQITYPKGEYLTYKFLTNTEADLDIEVQKFWMHLKNNNYCCSGDILITYDHHSKILNGTNFSFILQIKIKT